jgi:type II secretory pathway pseudopilin PulG
MKSRGFTLVETVVIVGVLGVILIAVTNILLNSFRAKTRVEVADRVEENGESAMREIRENVISAMSVGMTCAVNVSSDGSTISLQSINDGEITNLVCYEGSRIASESAKGNFNLTSDEVRVTGCSDFARCELFPDSTDRIDKVNFSFMLSAGNLSAQPEKSRTRSFNTSVVPRN